MDDPSAPESATWAAARGRIVRDALGVSLATGAYALSFGAISIASGLTVLQTCILSVVMFTGGSQFALVGVIAGGGSPLAGAATAVMLGSRNALYGLRLASILQVRSWRRFAAAQFVIDETTAMSVGRPSRRAALWGFYSTGILLFSLWNLGTLIGALGANAIQDPKVFGLDAAVTGAFVALLAPQVRSRQACMIALCAAAVAVAAAPYVPAGVPVLVAAAVAAVFGLRKQRGKGRDRSIAVDDAPPPTSGSAS
ncbi:branched-chain amino acid ABC transporter permease [Nakamurella antarctica]|uniref:Branched-chain amino acid ABC transporter permease n=1 Tax=Nakamurella antarctica TaxID=1902245 RepID=A0A3G8ZL89_9ACTN|nr:AzlC family ABC transporter permease [Nakamurella antarctica]AZI57970.1 branched-chain amino acid ABC transporter permease [Nakamurella antarctica]